MILIPPLSDGTFINPQDHTNFSKTNCLACHLAVTPALPHVQNTECSACHKDTSPWNLPIGLGDPNIIPNHNLFPNFSTTNCTLCHVADNPPPPHVQGFECSTCHDETKPWVQPNITIVDHSAITQNCSSCHTKDRPLAGRRMNRDPNLANNSHYGKTDCSECHRGQQQANSPWGFEHRRANGMTNNFCLPCHYDRGIREHDNRPNWFQPPIYDFPNQALGNCFNCHNQRKSFDD